MQFPYYSQVFGTLLSVTFTITGNADVVPHHYEGLAARALITPDLSNVTSLNNRFADLSVNSISLNRQRFTINQVALGFINALKVQAIEDCDEHMSTYSFTDTEYEDDPIRIRINAAAGSPEGQLVRCNILYAIKTLAINLMASQRPYGAMFTESYRGQLLYEGRFDKKNEVLSLAQSSNSSANPNETAAQEKRALSTHSSGVTNSSTSFLTIPGPANVEYRIEFDFPGDQIGKAPIFSAILEFMMALAQLDSAGPIENTGQADPTTSAWIFVMHDPESDIPLQGFQLVAILESIARHSVNRARFGELVFNFFIDEEFVAGGCVTRPEASRAWCQGFREGGR